LRKPFEQFAQLPNNPEWRAREDESMNWHTFLKIPKQ